MPAPKKYTDELRERAVRLVVEMRKSTGQRYGALARVADQLGINRETLRNWVHQAEVDAGQRPGTSTADAQRLAETELVARHGPWHNLAQLELSTLEYVDWFDHRRLHEACGYRSPSEYEALYYKTTAEVTVARPQ